ncbi:hypothetical protein SLEP1_g35298 [Rubroshorea leprosula]|uniref:Uncharacterized protein n=1 Tax=Rubroshorea leprosula TaxID=152421 RepID=A0AAV5KMQ8_9ROSI|nr:hypothetical protein SLEP1_g35298 [Rubroshorea leprosula]
MKSTRSTVLIRYGSAIGSAPSNPNLVGHYFTADFSSLTSESTCKVNSSNDPQESKGALHGYYGGSSSLLRQRSPLTRFLNHLTENATMAALSNVFLRRKEKKYWTVA